MPQRPSSSRKPPTESRVVNASWEGEDISRQAHVRVAFSGLDLSEVVNEGATFTECTFHDARFNASRHVDAAFVGCTFTGCSFFDARFTGCKMVGSTFERCAFDLLAVEGGNWSHVSLVRADLRRATFRGARLVEAVLAEARCDGATMRDLDLSGASLDGARLDGCDLRGSDLGGAVLDVQVLRGAIVSYEQAITIAMMLGLDVRSE